MSEMDWKAEPVVALLKRFGQLSQADIQMEVASWWHDKVGSVEFENARKRGTIVRVPGEKHVWKLAKS